MSDVNVTEKVARALYEHRLVTGDFVDGSTAWDDLPEPWRDEWREGATAALAALSDPEVLAGMAGVLYEADPLPGKPSWGGLRSESAQWPDGVARWAETRALERASALADWLRGQES